MKDIFGKNRKQGRASTGRLSRSLVRFGVAFLVASPLIAEADVALELSRIGDASHLEFSGTSNWKYDMKRDASGADRVTLRVPNLKPAAVQALKKHTDPLIRAVNVNEAGVDGLVEVTFTLQPGVDFFDYVSEDPSSLVVDFFPKEVPKGASQVAVASEPPPAKLPAKAPEARVPASNAEAELDEDAESTGGVVVRINPLGLPDQLPIKTKKGDAKRKPAGGDFVLLPKGGAVNAPSMAEKISSQKDFSHGIFDGGDPEFRRFAIRDFEVREDAILESQANYYLPFPMLELGSKHLQSLVQAPPVYEIVPADTQENKEARLLLMLFTNKRRAVFLKTAEQFLNAYPGGTYEEIVRYMMADTYFDLWKTQANPVDFEAAMGQYLLLSEKFPNSPLTARTLLLMSYSYVARGDSFNALKTFQRFVRMKPESKYADQVKISISEAYLRLNRYDDALSILGEVEKTGKRLHDRQEASFRRGDVLFKSRKYEEAIKEYRGAVARHADAAGRFPNAYYNTAEAGFIGGKYREALEDYRQFLVKFPDHEHGGYAMTRMGELLDIFGADHQRAMGAFMESYFRYRATPGAGVARMRMLTSRMAEMKDKELASALTEIAEIAKRYSSLPKADDRAEEKRAPASAEGAEGAHAVAASGDAAKADGAKTEGSKPETKEVVEEKTIAFDVKPVLPGIEEFATLLVADGFTNRREYDRSANDLITYYQKNPQSPNKSRIINRIELNVAHAIRDAVNRGDFIDALRRYSKQAGGWLKNSPRADVGAFVGEAYEQAGVFKEAETFYKAALKKVVEMKKSGREKQQRVYEAIPRESALTLRLAAVAAKQKDYLTAEKKLKEIKDGSGLTEAEQIERAEVSAEVAEARGQTEAAKKYLAELMAAWKGDPALTSPLLVRLAKLHGQSRGFKEAEAALAKAILMRAASGSVPDDVHAKALELRGDYFLARGKRGDAVKAYRALLTEYESKRPLASVRYRVGQILFENGDLKGAEAEWGELKSADAAMWQRLADEQMQSAKWQTEYRKYLQRIPAASSLDGSKSSARR